MIHVSEMAYKLLNTCDTYCLHYRGNININVSTVNPRTVGKSSAYFWSLEQFQILYIVKFYLFIVNTVLSV